MPYPVYDSKDFIIESKGYSVEDYAVVISFLIVFAVVYFVFPYLKSKKSKFDFVDEFLILTAFVLCVDGNLSSLEKSFVDLFIEKEFGKKKKNNHLDLLDEYLEKFNLNINKILHRIDREEVKEVKMQLLYFLVKITVVDRYLKKIELVALNKICRGIGLSPKRLKSMLAMHSYKSESENQRQKRKNRSTTNKRSSYLLTAYLVLELTEKASNSEIKKAYRKLVVLYHPDKVMHLDNQIQRGSKEMFQKMMLMIT
jgi:DnaJ like chaperone protein